MLEPRSVDQILRVLELVRQNRRLGFDTRTGTSRAIQQVADETNVRYQTIGDGCRRRLGLPDMSAFHRLVEDWLAGDGDSLLRVLKQNSSDAARPRIDKFFASTTTTFATTTVDKVTPVTNETSHDELVRITLTDSDSRMLRVLAQLHNGDAEALGAEILVAGVRQRLRAALS